ncbi:MAG: Fe-S cluster assembly ATPase SufC [Bdellovibrionaceae bacterium]|nr:Fe-S cluster assembly ATPase SufC [Pseudobdellovibrionaceae bacterium]
MLKITNLHVSVNDKPVLKGLNLEVKAGEVHAIMGPNGSGKSTLSKVIAGHPAYTVTQGTVEYDINFKMKNILEMPADERAREGIFLAFQYPVEVPGVTNLEFLKASYNAIAKQQGFPVVDDEQFLTIVRKKLDIVKLNESFLYRAVNSGFSGGEKKKNEIVQMAVMSPRLCFLDETDSGLDIDALKVVSEGINSLKNKNNAFVLVTHYQRLLDYVQPDVVHVLSAGQIVKTGGKELALELEKKGYESYL